MMPYIWVKHMSTSFSKLDNTVNKISIFNTKCPEISKNGMYSFMIFPNTTFIYNHPYNLRQKFVPSLQLIFTFLFHSPNLLSKAPSQSPATLPSITLHFLTSLSLHTSFPKHSLPLRLCTF